MFEKLRNRKDVISGSFFLLLGLFLTFSSPQFRIWSRSGPRAGFFPLALGLIMILLSLILLFQSAFSKRPQGKVRPVAKEAQGTKRLKPTRIIPYGLSMLLYGLLIKTVGFFITTFLFLCVILKYVEGQGWRRTLLLGVTTTLLGYILFKYWLGVPLPLGVMKDMVP